MVVICYKEIQVISETLFIETEENTRTILEENFNKTILKEERFKLVLLTKLNCY